MQWDDTRRAQDRLSQPAHAEQQEQNPDRELQEMQRDTIEKMTEEISKMAQGKQIKIDIQEIKTPELDAQLVAENVALQIERRIAYRTVPQRRIADFGAGNTPQPQR